jgi:hypothetical protein
VEAIRIVKRIGLPDRVDHPPGDARRRIVACTRVIAVHLREHVLKDSEWRENVSRILANDQ